MAVAPGIRLGHFEVVAAIGAGGMGEVYKARDTRLDRIVAIKVLRAHLADKPELRERFEREARTIASLNYPHICTLYDIGRQDGTDFLVMEYLEGETLATRLLKGPLPLERVLQYAIEISDALDKAHRKGVTHRDIKPGNVMLTKSGTKLLDFGLAKLKQAAAPASLPESQMATLSRNPTIEGTLLGTIQYMAPEQVEGKNDEIDGRTDIFAFGALVYEMATGKKAFEGKTQASLVAKILEHNPPPMSSLRPMMPPALDRVVKKCLAKDPDERWQTASDLNGELQWIAEGGSQVTTVSAAREKGISALRRPLVVGLGALSLGAVIAGLTVWNLKPAPAPRRITRYSITLPQGQQLAGLDDAPAVALSPDGTYLAYVATQGGAQQIYLRAMDSVEPKLMLGTEGASGPFFSPDGQSVGFFAGGKLKKVSVRGGAALSLSDAIQPRGASWGSQGTIVFAPDTASVLQQVSEAGDTRRALTRFDKGEVSHRWPAFLPDGQSVLFSAGGILVEMGETGERRELVESGATPRYASSGHLVYVQAGTLMAQPFDTQRLEVSGKAVPVVENVLQAPNTGAAQYGISDTGSLIYVSGDVQSAQSRLVWVSRNGTEQALAAAAHNYSYSRLSPDGRLVAVTIREQGIHVWLYDISRQTLSRFTFDGNVNAAPTWTPDGKRIAFLSTREGPQSAFWQMADGSGGPERLTTSEYSVVPISWSSDGKLLAFIEINPNTANDIWVLRVSDRQAQPFLRTRFNEGAPSFSPDGRWLAYVSDETGRFEVYVQPYPGPGGKWQISTEGGTEPVWNPNGRELFYRSGNKMMAVDAATQTSFSVGSPRMLFEGAYLTTQFTLPYYDVSSDGQRFLMVKPTEQALAGPTQINVVLNWFEELKQRVPAGTK
jgi:Tol biopolymer transport system component/tRNA A-37 threonylcarbamoyl transferase component Bud32